MKSLREHLTEVATSVVDKPTDAMLFEIFVEDSEEVCKDGEDDHRWYTNWRHVYKVNIDSVNRYFAITLPTMKDENAGWYDIDFKGNIDNTWEVFPEQTLTTVYK